MSSEQPRRARETGGSGTSPIGSTAAIVIAVVAVIGGFLILRQINSDDGGGGGTAGPTVTLAPGATAAPGTAVVDPGLTVVPTIAVPTTPPVPTTSPAITTGATIVVANASTFDGAAGRFTTALKAKSFTTGEPVTASKKVPVSVVYYDAADANSLPVATYLASLLGNIAVEPLETTAPVAGGTLAQGVTVLLLLGSDKADKTLEVAGAPTTTIAGAATVTSIADTATTV